MLDVITFFKNYHDAEPSDKLLKLKEHSEKVTGKPYYILIKETKGDHFSASVSTDSEKHTIELPHNTLQKINDIEVVETLIAHEILHPQLETKGFIKYPFNEGWKNLVYHIILDLIINRVELPKYDFNYSRVVYKFNLRNIDFDAKYGFRAPMLGNNYEKVLIIVGTLLNCRWFWNKKHPQVHSILKILKRKYTNAPLGDIYEIMSKELHNINDLCSYSFTYEKTRHLTNEIEKIFSSKRISFTEVER